MDHMEHRSEGNLNNIIQSNLMIPNLGMQLLYYIQKSLALIQLRGWLL